MDPAGPGKKLKTVVPSYDHWKGQVPCQAACPVRTDSGKYVQLIGSGDYESSYLIARSPNPFASVCGRVCAAPCEDRCRRGTIDAPVSIRALKRFVCERYGIESLLPGTQDRLFEGDTEGGSKTAWHLPMLAAGRKGAGGGRKVVVVGAGPAGLSCAHDLALMGYRVTVFEASGIPGGMMFHGIPEFRLVRPVIDKEIERILHLGVELKLNSPLHEGFGLQELRDLGYEAVFIGVGTQQGRDLRIEGQELDGVVKAIDFLLNVNRGYRVTLGEKVAVIGGGFVAFDAARTALRAAFDAASVQAAAEGEILTAMDAARAAVRAGVSEVHIVSLESFEEMPVLRTALGKEEFEEAEREGIHFRPQRGSRRFLGKEGRVTGVELVGVKRTYDADGRFDPIYDSGVSEVLEADTVILAVGQQADLSFLRPEDGVQVTPQGTIRVDPETLATTAPGVFAGGDVAFGPRNLIDAIANGKRAALSIDDALRGAPRLTAARLSIRKIPAREYRMPAGYEKRGRQAPPVIDLDRRTGISEVETGYSDAEARRQAERCLFCHVQTIYDPKKCVLCNRCVDVCPERCLKLVPMERLDLEPEAAVRLLEHYGFTGGGDERLSAMVKDDERCIRCGLCAIRCPTDAMTMEVFRYEEDGVAP